METAPNSNFESKQPEEKMPWTDLDVETAETMLVTSEGYDHNIKWIGRMTRAARKMGFDGYSDERLSGIREYLSHKGGLASDRKKELEELLKEERKRSCEEASLDPDRKAFIEVGESHD